MKDLNKNIKNLDKTVYGTLDVMEMLSSLLGDIYKLIQPIFKLLSMLLLIFFMPFIPIIKLLVEKLAEFAKWILGEDGIKQFTNMMEKVANILDWWWTTLKNIFIGILKGFAWFIAQVIIVGQKVAKGIANAFNFIKEIFIKGRDLLSEGFLWLQKMLFTIWENYIKPPFEFLLDVGKWIWENCIKPPFEFLSDVGKWIWNQILKPAWEWFKDIGTKIWNILKSPFDWLANKIKSINIFRKNRKNKDTSVDDAIIKPNGDIIRTHPKDYIFATKTPEKMGGGGQVTVNINNPSVRNDSDIKKIAEQVSKVMERRLWRSY